MRESFSHKLNCWIYFSKTSQIFYYPQSRLKLFLRLKALGDTPTEILSFKQKILNQKQIYGELPNVADVSYETFYQSTTQIVALMKAALVRNISNYIHMFSSYFMHCLRSMTIFWISHSKDITHKCIYLVITGCLSCSLSENEELFPIFAPCEMSW